MDRLSELIEGWGGDAEQRIKPIFGDLTQPMLGVDDATREQLRGNVDHFFHLAALYDMSVDDERNQELNVSGTQHAIDLANDIKPEHFHYASSIAVAGTYDGHFTEDMFDERSEERRVGKECRSRGSRDDEKKKAKGMRESV